MVKSPLGMVKSKFLIVKSKKNMVEYFDTMLYPLVMTSSSPWYRWSIEIDGLPSYKMGGFSMANG